MKVLWLRNEDSHRAAPHLFTPLRESLGQVCQVETRTRCLAEAYGAVVEAVWMGGAAPPAPLLAPGEAESFDAVILETGGLWHTEPLEGVPTVLIWGDNHREKNARWLADALRYVDLFLPILGDSFRRLHPGVYSQVRARWFPWWIDPAVFRDYGLPKLFDVLSTGHLHPGSYPVRTAASRALCALPGYHRVDRPPDDGDAVRWPLGASYAKLLNGARLSLSCTGAWGYGLGKCYEVPAVRSVLVSDGCVDMTRMGHVAGDTFLEISLDPDETLDRVRELISDPVRLHRIADAGYELVHGAFTVRHAVRRLLAHLETLT